MTGGPTGGGKRRTTPPPAAESLLAKVLPQRDRAPVLRDLAELYRHRMRSRSRLWSEAWYWRQVASFTLRMAAERVTGSQGPGAEASDRPLSGGTLANSIAQDVRYAVRGLMRSPGFALVAIMTLALGVGASTSIFSVVNGVLLRPLPFPDADRLVVLHSVEPDGERDNHSGANYLDIKERSRSFSGLAGHRGARYTLVGGGLPEVVRGSNVTSNFFTVLGVQALLGRALSPEVDVAGSERSVVLSYGMWQSQFGGDAAALGQSVRLNGEPYTVVGVMPPGFAYPSDAGFWTSSRYEVPEAPVDVGENPASVRSVSWFSVFGRLAPEVTFEQAQAEMLLIAGQLADEYPESNSMGDRLQVVRMREAEVGEVRASLYVLFGAVGFLLLIACANVANLLLARASAREREIVVRIALGASRVRILRQLATESLVLALAAGLGGFIFAVWGTQALLSLAPVGIPRMSEVGVDFTVLVFTLVIALGTGLLVGLAPALQSLGGRARSSASLAGNRQTAGRARTRLRSALVVAEVAVSLLLLVGAGLMIRTLVTLTGVEPGFDPANTLSTRVWIPAARYQEDEQIRAFYAETLERVRAIPGVESAGAVLSLPVNAGIHGTFLFAIENRPVAPDEDSPLAEFQIASPEYFETIGIPLKRGRLFTRGDDPEAPRVAIVNEELAKQYWPNDDAIGKRVVFGDPDADDVEWMTIVGIVGNTRQFGLDQPAKPEIYQPYLQGALPFMTLVVKSEIDVAVLTAAIRRAVMAVDPEQPISAVATMDQVLFDSLGSRRFNMLLLAVFAVAALLLAAVGLVGVLSYTVAQRANEIGVRMALGARGSRVVRDVMRQGVSFALVGVAIGAAGALALTRWMTSMIYGVSASDPITFLGGAALLVGIAAVASCIPALRAARLDPIEVLRAD